MGKSWCYIKVNPNSRAKIDTEDRARVEKHTWRVLKKQTGRKKVVTNIIDKGRNRQISLGQFLMKPTKGKMVYPRRFMEEFDYRKSNLIVCTIQERQRILPKSRRFGTSKYKGVSYTTSTKLWRAAIKIEGRTISIGYFKNEDQAAIAYNKVAERHFGKDTYLNLVGPRRHKRNKI